MEFKEQRAIYLQIADYMCDTILMRKWKGGERIPSVRELAVSMEVNPNTAMRTYTYLQEKEIIFNKRGIGYFVAVDGYSKTLELKKTTFIKKEMPAFIKSMKLLEIDFKLFKELFNK
ncbi:MAG: GntR family transcriptional regulator [Bacteroidetes bacterium]|nr:GntR family transcriptional regulator [Bacteroidota bacterium]